MKTKFDESLCPLLLADIDSDIPNLSETEDSVLFALNGDSLSAADDSVPEEIEGNNPVERAVSLVIGVAQDLQGTDNKDTNHSAALYATWVSTKLMVAMLRYMETNTTGSWEDFAALDMEEEGAEESDESNEEDTEDDEGTE